MTIIGKRYPAPVVAGVSTGPKWFPDLNFFSSGVFIAGQKVKSFGVGIPADPLRAPTADTDATISLYKVVDGEINGAVRVWTKSFVIPQGHTGWFVQNINFDDVVGVADGDVLCAAFIASPTTGNNFSIHHEIYTDPVVSVVSAGYSTPPGTTPEVWEDWGLQNREPYFYVELEAPSGINELVPAAVDALVGAVENPEIADTFGINFRDTLGYVTDPPGTAGWVRNEQYPTTRAGITFGMVAPPSNYFSRNRNASTDPRLAGLTQVQNSGVLTHRIDLLRGPNTYRVRIAAGDFSNPKTQNLRIRDGAGGSVLLQFSGVVSATNQFLDATGVARTAAQWPSNNVPVDLIFTADHCIIELGQGAGGSTSNDTGLAHISFEYFPPAPTEFDGVIAESLPPATDAITGTFAAPIYTAAIAELVPAALDALQGSYADAASFAGTIAEALPAALDALQGSYADAASFAGAIAEAMPSAVDAVTAVAAAPIFTAAVTEQLPAAMDAVTGTYAAPGYVANIAEALPAAVDALTAASAVPVFDAAVNEALPPAVDSISAINFGLGTSAFISETVPAAVDAITAEAAVPEWMGAIAELVPPSFDAVTATHTAPGFAGNITELMPAANDAIIGTAAAPIFPGAITEFVPPAIDSITGRHGGFESLSAARTLKIPAENRTLRIAAENRVFIVQPENRTLKIRR